MKKIVLSYIAILYSISVFSWGGDVEIPSFPNGKVSLVKTANGTLFCSIPVGQSGVGGINFFQSTDLGVTWTLFANPAMGQNVKKSKLVVTGTDSVYCAYQVDSSLFFYSLAGNVVTPFTTMLVDDYDIVASPNSNSVYLYCDNFGTNAMNRYSSVDGGYTWTGSSALVASASARPRLYMSGTKLIVNYYATIASTSIIRAGSYNETAPGQLAPDAFLDLLTAGVSHPQMSSVMVANIVWFLYTEGTSSNVIKYRLSNDNGISYGLETLLAGNLNMNAQCFDAVHYSDLTGSGIKMVYYSDSLGTNKKMNYATASSLSPSLFSSAEIVSDYSADCLNETMYPSIAAPGSDVGVVFLQSNAGIPGLYFDLRSFTVGISEIEKNIGIQIYPNPMQSTVTIELVAGGMKHLVVTDVLGRVVHNVNTRDNKVQLDLHFLQPGIYFIGYLNKLGIKLVKN